MNSDKNVKYAWTLKYAIGVTSTSRKKVQVVKFLGPNFHMHTKHTHTSYTHSPQQNVRSYWGALTEIES